MDKFITLLTLLLQEAKDPAALLKRLLTILVSVIIYLAITNTSEVVSFLRVFSTNSVLQDMHIQRVNKFPIVAREKSMILYSQTNADAVFVVKYKPDSINDYQNIIAWESKVQIDEEDTEDKAVNKASQLYRRQLEGFNYVVTPRGTEIFSYNGVDIPSFKAKNFGYIFTCPFFNLNNIYAGYIAIAYQNVPVNRNQLPSFEEFLSRHCSQQQRQLGRSI